MLVSNPDITKANQTTPAATSTRKYYTLTLKGLKASELTGWKRAVYKIILLAPIAIMGVIYSIIMTPIAPILGTAFGAALGTLTGSIISTSLEYLIRKCMFGEKIDRKELWRSNMITAAKCTAAAFAGGVVGGAIAGALSTYFATIATNVALSTQVFANFCLTGIGAATTTTVASIALRAGIGGALKVAKVPEKDVPSAFSLEKKTFLYELKSGLLVGGAAESLGAVTPAAAPFAALGLVALGNIVGQSIVTAINHKATAKVSPEVEMTEFEPATPPNTPRDSPITTPQEKEKEIKIERSPISVIGSIEYEQFSPKNFTTDNISPFEHGSDEEAK